MPSGRLAAAAVRPAPVIFLLLLAVPLFNKWTDRRRANTPTLQASIQQRHTEPEQPTPAEENVESSSSSMDHQVILRLLDYGYIADSDRSAVLLRDSIHYRDAIAQFQEYAQLPVTGMLDPRTRQQLVARRCGFPDKGSRKSGFVRYALQGRRWHKTHLTWTILSHTRRLSLHQVRQELEAAFRVWRSASPLTFTYVESDRADILVSFARGAHRDQYDFDGEGQVLAHAFFPGPGRGGDAHFDDDEQWVTDEVSGYTTVSLFAVAVHEFGHSLGLEHSNDKRALMFPWYQTIVKDSQLPDDDRLGLEKLYGRLKDDSDEGSLVQNGIIISKKPRPTTEKVEDPPNPCSTSYDAASYIDKTLFIFSGKYFWKINEATTSQNIGAIEITSYWEGLPKNISTVDAVYHQEVNNLTVIFIDRNFWVFHGRTLLPYYPRPLTEMGLPQHVDRIDAALVWSQNNRPYLFRRNLYWRLMADTRQVDSGYPRSVRLWPGVPAHMDAALQLNTTTYFFRGLHYWQYDQLQRAVTSQVPALAASRWMPGCWLQR